MKLPNLMRTFDSVRFDSIRFRKLEIENISFLSFLMIRFDRIELATYKNKHLDSMDFKVIEAFNSSLVRSNQIGKDLKFQYFLGEFFS